MKAALTKILIGSTGIGATEIVQSSLPTDPTNIVEISNILIQIVVAIATLFGLFKRKKVAKTNKF
jgi:hypothetical protein